MKARDPNPPIRTVPDHLCHVDAAFSNLPFDEVPGLRIHGDPRPIVDQRGMFEKRMLGESEMTRVSAQSSSDATSTELCIGSGLSGSQSVPATEPTK